MIILFPRVLHEVRVFVQTETRPNIYHRFLSGDTISIRRVALEQRLASLPDIFKVRQKARDSSGTYLCSSPPFQQYITDTRAGEKDKVGTELSVKK